MRISIIIPVFNAEKYLERLMRSVFKALEKTGEAYEVLLIDNKSTDNSLGVAEKIAKSHAGVSILKHEKAGAAAVRNYGVKKARGDFVWFIDADDEIAPDSVCLLLKEATSKQADLVMMGAKRVYADGRADYLSAIRPEEPNFKSRFVRYGAGPWQFLIRRKWWLECNFLFKEGIIHEDMEMISALILYTEKFAAVDKPLYIYHQNNQSVLHKNEWDPHYFDIFPALEGLYARFKKVGSDAEYHDELEWFFIWNLLIDSAKDFAKFPEGRTGFERSREMLKQYFPNWRKNRFLKQKPLKLKIKIRLNYRKK